TGIIWELNPHPAGQVDKNVPTIDGRRFDGLQHKYPDTILVFPDEGQTCQAYCGYCFRFPEFIKDKEVEEIKFTATPNTVIEYLRALPPDRRRQVKNILITGGDPGTMTPENLMAYIEPLLTPEFDHITTIRLGTKTLSHRPGQYVKPDQPEKATDL